MAKKIVEWARGREFSRRCPDCGARIQLARHVPWSLSPHSPRLVKRTFECGTEQCFLPAEKKKRNRWTQRTETCYINEIIFWRELARRRDK